MTYTREQIEAVIDYSEEPVMISIVRQLLAELDAKSTKKRDQKRAERQAKAKAKLEALKRKAASSCFCYVE